MAVSTDKASKKIDIIFVFAIITLFAATAFILVLIGAKQYRSVTDSMNKSYEDRTVASYITEKLRQSDTKDAILVEIIDGIQVLSIAATENDVKYTTYIYLYDGYLRELVTTEGSAVSLSGGQEIIAVQRFSPRVVKDSLIQIEVTDTDSNIRTLYFNLHSSSGKEAL